MIHRQTVVHAVVWAGVYESGEPKAPLEHAEMAGVGRFRQARGPGSVDGERAIGDGYAAPLVSPKPLRRISFYVAINLRKSNTTGFALMRPDFRPRGKMRGCRLILLEEFRRDDEVLGCGNIDAMGKRRTAQIGIQQCDDAADGGDTEP